MALQLGFENKRQVKQLAALLGLIALIGGYEVYSALSAPSTPVRTAPPPAAPVVAHAPKPSPDEPSMGPQAQKLNNAGIDPRLHFDILAQSELVEVSGSGRNIFSADTAPAVRIEQPVKSARPSAAAAVVPSGPPEPPKPPAIDLKYFGYKMSRDKTLQAFFVHGEDIFVAKPGDIINRRYQIGAVRPSSVEVTDLAYKNTQNITLSPF